MQKEIFLDITTGIVVLGSVFGVSHWRKLKAKLRAIAGSEEQQKMPQGAAATPSADKVLSFPPLGKDDSAGRRKVS